MMKIVLKLDILDEKTKQKVMKNVSCLSGVDSLAMDMKDKKLTVTGDVDPVTIVSKLRKICNTEIVSVGPAKEPEKKKDDGGAAAGGGGGDKKKKENDKKKGDGKNKEEAVKIAYAESAYYHQPYPYYYQQQQIQQPYYYSHPPAPYYSKAVNDDNPNCVIC